jgi:hypothetical protein
MSPESALRHEAFVKRQRGLAARVQATAAALEAKQGHRPSYWALVDLARRELSAEAL